MNGRQCKNPTYVHLAPTYDYICINPLQEWACACALMGDDMLIMLIII